MWRYRVAVLVCPILGLVSAVSAAESLPEFYGFYATDGGQLHEFAGTDVQGDFSPNVRFILFDKRLGLAQPTALLHRMKFLRHIREPADPSDFNAVRCVVKKEAVWIKGLEKERQFELRAKPIPGQTEMVMLVPRDPLIAGAYLVAVGDQVLGYLFVEKTKTFAGLENSDDCVDAERRVSGGIAGMMQGLSGSQTEIACSRSTMKAGTVDRCQASVTRAGSPEAENTAVGAGAASTTSPESKALTEQLTTLQQRTPVAPRQPDKTYGDENSGVSFSYPADYELTPLKRPIIASLLAPVQGQTVEGPPNITVTMSVPAARLLSPTLDRAVKATLDSTRATLTESYIAGPIPTKLGNADAQVFLVTGKEGGVLRQKAVTIAVVNKNILGVVLHATPETFEAAWDAYRLVTNSYTLL
jgi:hypothetical protein